MTTGVTTGKLIEELAAGLAPTKLLPPPSVRVANWLALSLLFVAAVVVIMSPRPDLAIKLLEWRFPLEQAAALLTGAAAAYAAFASTIPAVRPVVLLLPLLPLALWLGLLAQGCLQSWLRHGPEGLSLHPDWMCFPSIVLAGSLPALLMVAMLRRGAPLTPRISVALGGLAAAGLGDFGLRMFHAQDAGLMVLVWQLGSVLVLTALAGSIGRQVLNWRSVAAAALRRT